MELDNKKIKAIRNNEIIFVIEAPYMFDSNNRSNNNIYYQMNENDNNYELDLILDNEWLNRSDIRFPITIDPTITNSGSENNVYDTYIYSGDTNVNRNSQDILKVGVERVDGNDVINRALIKFELPKIGTGSQIISASANLVPYPVFVFDITDSQIVNIHQLTTDWNEENANWATMHDKYNTKIVRSFDSIRSEYDANGNITTSGLGVDITNLVKKWYADTPNYGIMLKANEEVYKTDKYPAFFSKNNNIEGENPKPYLTIVYRNQNGLEEYMDYTRQSLSNGNLYINNYNGNLIGSFNIGSTVSGKLPAVINLVYNTNDVVLNNNIGYGLGYKLNYNQTIQEEIIEKKTYLKYTDMDGTIHYFVLKDNVYNDEDGLNMTITVNADSYILKDKNNNQMKFTIASEVGYLSEIIDVSGNKVQIFYNSDNNISKVIDADNQEINLLYEENKISVMSPDKTTVLNYANNQIASIVSITGTTSFTYSDKNVLSSITDESGLKFVYEYYNLIPYRVRKVMQYGLNNVLGNYFTIEYNFNSTTIIDDKNRATTMTFNNFGNIESITNLKSKEVVKDAYGKKQTYGSSVTTIEGEFNMHKNKLLNEQIPVKYVKNFLTNTSFENDEIIFSSSENVSLNTTEECYETGLRSLKVINTVNNEFFTKNISVSKDKYYTFSAYLKNDNNIKLSLSYINSDNELIESKSELIKINNEFNRYDVTIFYPAEAISDLTIKVYLETTGTLYIDDIQLEEGEVANAYNLLENSDFSSGIIDWNLSATEYSGGATLPTDGIFEIVTLSSGIKALKVKMNPNQWTSFEKTFNIRGKGGDTYNISFWYKNEGFVGSDYEGAGTHNNVIISFNYINQDGGHGISPSQAFNPNDNEWQYFSTTFVAEKDFESLRINFYQSYNANDFYITNLSLFKDTRSIGYGYDEFDNIQMFSGLDNQLNEFNYDDNNKLIKITNPKGKNFTFEYDNIDTKRVLKGISGIGISNERKYDNYGNPIVTKVTNYGKNDVLESGLYNIRLKGTDKYLKNNYNALIFRETSCDHDLWLLEKVENSYKIKHYILDKYIIISNNSLVLGDDNDTLFTLIRNNNGSYLIKNTDDYLKSDNDMLELSSLIESDYHFEFYFENTDDLFIENSAEYTEDGRFIKNTTDTNFNKMIYDIDEITGLTKSITNPGNHTTNYEYNGKRQLIKVTSEDKSINYLYNDNGLLSKIVEGEREYNFYYDNFLNPTTIKVGDNITLITNNYEENNGDLISSVYGNNDNLRFEYDEFSRIKKIIKMNDNYEYKYGNNGDLVKVISNNDVYKYTYDLAKRIQEYRFNDFKVKYDYDENSNVSNKMYGLNDTIHNITNTFNDDDGLIKTIIDDTEISYDYDYLGRIKKRIINNNYNTNYEYITNGKRTSLLLKSIKNNDELYSYKYDKLNNITHIYHNNNLTNRYYYDAYNQLVQEYNYDTLEIIKYKYDNYGNILNKKVYDFNNYNLLYENKYEYNNSNWIDQLTKFNNEIITYDEIGNPISIGNKTLSWINGRELVNYIDENNNIVYKYNKDGLRISKIVNSIETKYFLENSKIILEKTGNNEIYYLYNELDNIIGFKYNDETYYYIKNVQNDIIGILNSECQVLVRYSYDSLGNIISITDNLGNDISNNLNHIGNINPYRYRSYYYDTETNLYYLNSRYYNPVWGRFISADHFATTGQDFVGNNMYSYTSNNFINRCDVSGYFWFHVAGFVFGGLISASITAVSNVVTGKDIDEGVVASFSGGATAGLLLTFGADPVTVSVCSSTIESTIGQLVDKGDLSLRQVAADVLTDYATGYVLGKMKLDFSPYINPSWPTPRTFKSSFTGNYTKRISKKIANDSVTSSIIDAVDNYQPKNNVSYSSISNIASSTPSSGVGAGGGFSGGNNNSAAAVIVGAGALGVAGSLGGGGGGGRF